MVSMRTGSEGMGGGGVDMSVGVENCFRLSFRRLVRILGSLCTDGRKRKIVGKRECNVLFSRGREQHPTSAKHPNLIPD